MRRRRLSFAHERRWRLWPRLLALAMALVAADAIYLATRWPDWKALASGPPPRSSFMQSYEAQRATQRELPPIAWRPVPIASMSQALLRALVVAEDSRFWSHEGVDVIALQDAWSENLERGRLRFGGSTISQQTAKNLFLTASRDPLRKWHELVLTLVMEYRLPKRRILELYANVAEFGLGVYGVEAAAQRYFGVSAASLSERQAVELAATLPSPRRSNPATRTQSFARRVERIDGHLEAARVAKPEAAPAPPAPAPPAPASPAPVDAAPTEPTPARDPLDLDPPEPLDLPPFEPDAFDPEPLAPPDLDPPALDSMPSESESEVPPSELPAESPPAPSEP